MFISSPFPQNRITRTMLTKASMSKAFNDENNIFSLITPLFFIPNSSAPVINIISYTKSKLSADSNFLTSVVTFEANTNLQAWEARADGAGLGQGALVGSGTTLTIDSKQVFNVDETELTNGDKEYRITIYGKNLRGVWSGY